MNTWQTHHADNSTHNNVQYWQTVPNDDTIVKTIESLRINGIQAEVVATVEQAGEKALLLIPEGSQVMDMTSVTLTESGIQEAILHSGKYDAVKNALHKMDKQTKHRERRQMGAAPDYAIGSVHAVTEDGEVLIASNSGSQLPAYVYGAEHVIWVVGAQKIVKSIDEGMKRIYDYVLPLEADRAHKAYGVSGSNVSKLLIMNKEPNPNRIHLMFIKEQIGY
jgi:hypothetical protein